MKRLTAILLALLIFLSACAPAAIEQPAATDQPAAIEQPAAAQPTAASATTGATAAQPSSPTAEQADIPRPATGRPVINQKGASANPHWLAQIEWDGNVWLVDANNGAHKGLTDDATGSPVTGTLGGLDQKLYHCCLSWSSDGKLLAFGTVILFEAGGGTRMQFNIWVYDVLRDRSRAVLQNVRMPTRLAFRPGTHTLAYDEVIDPAYFVDGKPDPSQARGIQGLDMDTGQTSQLVNPERGLWLNQPHWSPDGSLLGFEEQKAYEEPGPFALYDFTHQVYGAWNQVIGTYAFAPDNQRIAYDRLALGGSTGQERIWVSDIWGKNEQMFSPKDGPLAQRPSWSPKGDLLAYKLGEPLNSERFAGSVLVVQPVDGGAPRELARFDGMGPLVWSPDGARIAFTTGLVNQPTLTLLNVADGKTVNYNAGYDPVWMP